MVPSVPPAFLLLSARGHGHSDWFGLFLLYGLFGLAAMLVLGTPLLFCYLRLGWTGFLSFMAAGGFCAGLTAYAMGGSKQDLEMVAFFATTGIISGSVFRIILFGFKHVELRSGQSSEEAIQNGLA